MIIEAIIALLAGTLSFFSPCVLPIFPGYISFITGVSLEKLVKENEKAASRKILLSSLFFIGGFSLVFVLLGASASVIGVFLRSQMSILTKIAGIGIIIFGLHMTGILKIPYLYREKRIQQSHQNPGAVKSFLAGIFFSFGWTPCIGPVLAAILAWAAVADNFYKGILLLILYAIGLAIPFLLSALFLNYFMKYLRIISKHLHKIEISLGVILIALGILIFTNKLFIISASAGGISLDKYIPKSWVQLLTTKQKLNNEPPSKYTFELPDINGTRKSFSDLNGKIIIVNFWATWCPPCQDEMPELAKLYYKYSSQGLRIIGIAERSKPTAVKKFIEEKQIGYTIVFDEGEKIAERYGVFGLPATFIFDEKGNRIRTIDGYIEPKELDVLIASLINK
jgi:cytochrome c-type biogenesis protein